MPFKTDLCVTHVNGKWWRLSQPLVWEGRWELVIIHTGFQTDFASIPKPVRWLLDSGGRNAEAAVLHDAAWRESKVGSSRRVDPWDADGMFRRALRETGAPALTRGLMWFAVRVWAIVQRRFGSGGPSVAVKAFQLVGILAVGSLTALIPTIVAAAGLIVYWLVSWVVGLLYWPFERHYLSEGSNWPWYPFQASASREDLSPDEFLTVYTLRASPGGDLNCSPAGLREILEGNERLSEAQLSSLLEIVQAN